ncbi:hydroxyectoine utilization dehydratase EutB [soil metagenome]
MKPDERVTVDDVVAARTRVDSIALKTPTIPSPALSRIAGSKVSLKVEGVQPTGSFKVRGAASKILSLSLEERTLGVVTASTGNHGRAVAYVGVKLGVPVAVCVSDRVPPGKVANLEAIGCRVLVGGDSQDAAMEVATGLTGSEGMTLVHPFDDREVIAGQGTIGLELAEQVPDLTHALVPLSGGGLISGVALALKDRLPEVRVVGVSMTGGAAMAASLQAGHPVEMQEESSLADSLQGGIGSDNHFTYSMVRDLVDEVVLVSEERIWQAMLWAYNNHGLVIEGGGAVGIAALMSNMVDPGARVAVVCSGQNLEAHHLRALSESRPQPD